MIFILANNSTYNKKYRNEQYKYPRLKCHTDLLGFANIRVRIEDGWWVSHAEGNEAYLEEQLMSLADFKYIHLEYVDEEGHVDQYFPFVGGNDD